MELFRLLGTIAIQNGKAIDAINDTVQRASTASKKISDSFTAIGKKSTEMGQKMAKASLAAGAAFSGIVVGITKNYAEFEQLAGGAELMFGKAYQTVMKNAQEAYSTVQMSQNEYLQQVNGFATGLKTALGGNEQAAADLAHKIIKAEADIVAATGNTAENVQNAFNGIMKSNFTMLDNLQIGITPTKEGFQEVIDKVNEWNAANGNATSYQMGNLADMQSALVDYIDMVGMSGYASAEASGTIQGSFASAKAALSNLLTEFGKAGADMDKAYEAFEESAKNFAKNIGKLIGTVFENSPFLVIGTALLGLLAIMSPVLIAFGSLMTGIGALIPLLPKLAAGFSLVGKAMFANPIGLIVTGIIALVTAFMILWKKCDWFREFWIDLWDKIKTTFINAKDKLVETKDKIVDAFNMVVDFFKNNWKELLLLIVNPFAGAFALLYKHNDKFRAKVDALKTAVVNIWGKIKDGIVSKIETARDKIKTAIDKIKSFFNITLKFKKIKMPHIEISWKKKGVFAKAAKYIGLDGIPKFDVAWYKQGAIFDKPTLFATPYGMKGVGEAGAEAVTPIDKLQDYVSTAVASQNETVVYYLQKMVEIMADYFPQVVDGLDRPLCFDADGMANAMAVPMDKYLGRLKERKDRGR